MSTISRRAPRVLRLSKKDLVAQVDELERRNGNQADTIVQQNVTLKEVCEAHTEECKSHEVTQGNLDRVREENAKFLSEMLAQILEVEEKATAVVTGRDDLRLSILESGMFTEEEAERLATVSDQELSDAFIAASSATERYLTEASGTTVPMKVQALWLEVLRKRDTEDSLESLAENAGLTRRAITVWGGWAIFVSFAILLSIVLRGCP